MSRRFLLDTGPAGRWVEKKGHVFERAVELARRGFVIGTTTPVVGELWQGYEWSHTRDDNLLMCQRRLRQITIWPYDNFAAREFGRIYAELRRLGRPMQQIDMQVAAVALTLGDCTVVTFDSDLASVPGLDVTDWSDATV